MSKILVVAPHPDDEILGCGGAMAHHVKQEDIVRVLYATSGDKYSDPKEREIEAFLSCACLGVDNLEFMRLTDGAINRFSLEKKMVKLASKYSPDLVYLPALNEGHSDHKLVSRVAIITNVFPRIEFYEVFPGLDVVRAENCLDITPYIGQKIKALKCIKSQKLNLAEAYRSLARFRGIFTGVGKYAEAFLPYV